MSLFYLAFPTFASNSTFAVALNDSVILLSWKRVINVTDLTFSHYNYAVKMKNISIWVTLAVIRDNGSLLNETLKYYTYNLSASTTYFFQIVPSRLSFYHNVTELGNSSEEVNATTSAANVAHDFDILKGITLRFAFKFKLSVRSFLFMRSLIPLLLK